MRSKPITTYFQCLLADRIALRYCDETLRLLNSDCKNPAKLEPWVEINGIHSFISPLWDDSELMTVGPRQSKKIIKAAKQIALKMIKNYDKYQPILSHLQEMKAKGLDISGEPIKR